MTKIWTEIVLAEQQWPDERISRFLWLCRILSPMSALSDMQFRVGDWNGRLTPLPNNTELSLEFFLAIILKASKKYLRAQPSS